MSRVKGILIDDRDQVVTIIQPAGKGDSIAYRIGKAGENRELTAGEDIPRYHKLAREDIAKGSRVYKYGQEIGIATCNIRAGSHVHIHNLQSACLLQQADEPEIQEAEAGSEYAESGVV